VTAFIDEHRGRFGVEPVCRVLDVSASAYYQRATGRRSARAVEDERLLGVIRGPHAANYYALRVSADVEDAAQSGRACRP
jgi:putative transposase